VEYRFLPRTMYEEQMEEVDLTARLGSMFGAPRDRRREGFGVGRSLGDRRRGRRRGQTG
jgi:hypothetical protein